ncbi:MAG: AAA family ATPase [Anaerolineae bacterium]|nr:MAG: AAA family ATPase [Anaerolineae bacterium]
MARLSISLLGSFQVTLDGTPVTALESDKVRALLAYLAVEADRPHRRDTLTGLLWAEQPDRAARVNLRRALYNLRQGIGDRTAIPPFLLITGDTVQFNTASDYRLDVTAFVGHIAAGRSAAQRVPLEGNQAIGDLGSAVELYRGDFLAGLSVPYAQAFDEWLLMERERLRMDALWALYALAECHAERGAYEEAIACTGRLLALEPMQEEAHRYLMQLYALSGLRSDALRQYEECKRVLSEELGVEPTPDTTALYEQIRAGRLEGVGHVRWLQIRPRPPAFLEAETAQKEIATSPFVARDPELARLKGFLDAALDGRGQVAFVTGDPGQGKTALMHEFARRAMDAHPDLLVATGHGLAYSGIGDPYLPFREVMGALTGDVEARWAAGAIAREHALRLWDTLPLAAQALLEHGPALIDVFVPGAALLSRATAAAPEGDWSERMQELTGQRQAGAEELTQSGLFEQYTAVLHALAAQRPLLLALDDMQWADTASIGLLFHLGQRVGGSQILILGAYRPEEVALGRNGGRHPLGKALAEFKRHSGDVWVDLAQADQREGRQFVQAYLDTEPNRLGEGFRRALFGHTAGHPLFTIEMLRAMQERGDLVRDEDGRWVEGPTLDWKTLPTRVEAVIEERVGRLEAELREILSVASVEGEEFTAQVVARVQEIGERQLLQRLSRELEKRHRLVREGEEIQVGRQRLSRYWFAHALVQGYLYNGLGAGERALLHHEVAEVLEELYEGRTDEISPQLARHYAEAGEREKAVEYLSCAGDRARLAYAHAEAADHYLRALAFLKEDGKHERAARTLMKLGTTYHLAFDYQRARQAYDEGFALWQRARAMPPAATLPPAPHAFRRPRLVDPKTLDPTLAADSSSTPIVNYLFSGLLEWGPELEAIPDVARNWQVSQEGKQFVFHLRDDALWSDGAPVTAEDFAYAWKRMLDPVSGSPRAIRLCDIRNARAFHAGRVGWEEVGVHVLNALTLAVELEAPTPHFHELIAGTYPVPRHVVEKHGRAWTEMEHIVTNGPFRLESWKPGERIVLSRNPAYHGRFTGNVEKVELLLLGGCSDPIAKALELYEADRLDLVWLPSPDVGRARQRHADGFVSAPGLVVGVVGFDASRRPFDDHRVRRAFTLAIDREWLADVVLKSSGFHFHPATGGCIPPAMPAHSPGIGLPHDPEQARRLLAEAGYPGGRGFPAVEALTVSAFFGAPAEGLQAEWRKNLMVEIAWQDLEWGTFVERLSRAPPQLFLVAFGAPAHPGSFLKEFVAFCAKGWKGEAFTELLEEAGRTVDQEQRMARYRQADRILVQEAPLIPLIYGRLSWLIKPWVKLRVLQDDFDWKGVVIEPHE